MPTTTPTDCFYFRVREGFPGCAGDAIQSGDRFRRCPNYQPKPDWVDLAWWNTYCLPEFMIPMPELTPQINPEWESIPDSEIPKRDWAVKKNFPGWRVVEVNEPIKHLDVWSNNLTQGILPGHSPEDIPFACVTLDAIGMTPYNYLKYNGSINEMYSYCIYRFLGHVPRRIPMNPIFSKPLPLP